MAATITRGTSYGATETITNAKLHALVDSATIAGIINAEIEAGAAIIYSKLSLADSLLNSDINSGAGIVDTKLAQITTASKVHGTALTGLASIPSGAGAIPAVNLTFDYIKVSEVQASGTHGGTFTQDAWRTRVINTEDTDTGSHCSIASNQVTLVAGTYECHISCPAFNVNYHKARLYNITDSAVTLLGTSEAGLTGAVPAQTRSFIIGRFTITGTKVFEIQHYCILTGVTNGLGVVTAIADVNEVYTVAEFRKVA